MIRIPMDTSHCDLTWTRYGIVLSGMQYELMHVLLHAMRLCQEYGQPEHAPILKTTASHPQKRLITSLMCADARIHWVLAIRTDGSTRLPCASAPL